jgi:CRP/FNR family transcriptional regulator
MTPLDVEVPDDAGPWTRHGIRKGAYLARAGAVPVSLFVVTQGCLRVSIAGSKAPGRVLDFAMRGDWLGTEALAELPWSGDVVALDDGEVLALPVKHFEEATRRMSRLRGSLYQHFVGTMLRDRRHIAQMGVLNAQQRVAMFLVDLSERFAAAGDSAEHFLLPMLRVDIASYLGLALESVSRAFTSLHGQGVIRVRRRTIELRDPQALQGIALRGD